MIVVSVINYKGGVGKTTLTANLGAELAFRGHRVLLIDLDPQASLTFSFYRPGEWEANLADEHTLLSWYGSVVSPGPIEPLAKYVQTPLEVNRIIQERGNTSGQLDLFASHLGLIEVDLDFAYQLGGSRFQSGSPSFVRVYRSLTDALRGSDGAYDYVLIDCAPNFTMVTRTGVVASDHLLVPAKPDYLSTLGIDFLKRKIDEVVRDYNKVAAAAGGMIGPEIIGIVLTMVQHAGPNPIQAMRGYIKTPSGLDIPAFRQTIRENKSLYGTVGESSIPAVLADNATDTAVFELREFASEFVARVRV
jgi:chromosome partitioning protein